MNIQSRMSTAAVLGIWLLIGLFFTARNLAFRAMGQAIPWDRAILFEMLYWLVWAMLTPFVLRFARRFRLGGARTFRATAFHLPFALAVSSLQLTLAYGAYLAATVALGLLDPRRLPSRIAGDKVGLIFGATTSFLIYWVWMGFFYGFDYYRLYREHKLQEAQLELRASELRTRLARAQLDALKMQLHPHFLFNTLNTISVLMAEDVGRANAVLLRLSDLLRLVLESGAEQEVPLRQELAFLQRYLEIEQVRFADRLTVRTDVNAELLDLRVPNLILQPLVENAIRHGIASRPEPGRLEVRAQRRGDHLVLQVVDDGPGLPDGGFGTDGIGLTNTRARLAALYGEDQGFELSTPAGGGLQVSITIPVRQISAPWREA
jgi:signal transduction histidine kinase